MISEYDILSQRESWDLLVGVILDIDEVISHGLVGELMQDGADWVKASLHYEQLCLGLSLVINKVYLFLRKAVRVTFDPFMSVKNKIDR